MVDTCTSSTTRGRYARICVEVPLDQPLKTHVYFGNHRQTILYEGLNMLCTSCGRLGHNKNFCSFSTQSKNHSSTSASTQLTHVSTTTDSITISPSTIEWKTIQFPKRNQSRTRTSPHLNTGMPPNPNQVDFVNLSLNTSNIKESKKLLIRS